MSQLPLSLVLPDNHRGDNSVKDFFVTEANHLAYAWVKRWPEWPAPYHAINIFGPKGCGKSHLADIFTSKLTGDNITCYKITSMTEFDRTSLARFQSYILDGVARSDDWDEEALFHLMNYLAETGKSALITSQTPLSQMGWQLADLSSRLRSVPAQQVAMPDDDLLEALLDTYFANRQCQVAEPAMRYILRHVERSYQGVADIVQAIDKASLAEKRPVTTALVKDLFATYANKGDILIKD